MKIFLWPRNPRIFASVGSKVFLLSSIDLKGKTSYYGRLPLRNTVVFYGENFYLNHRSNSRSKVVVGWIKRHKWQIDKRNKLIRAFFVSLSLWIEWLLNSSLAYNGSKIRAITWSLRPSRETGHVISETGISPFELETGISPLVSETEISPADCPRSMSQSWIDFFRQLNQSRKIIRWFWNKKNNLFFT